MAGLHDVTDKRDIFTISYKGLPYNTVRFKEGRTTCSPGAIGHLRPGNADFSRGTAETGCFGNVENDPEDPIAFFIHSTGPTPPAPCFTHNT